MSGWAVPADRRTLLLILSQLILGQELRQILVVLRHVFVHSSPQFGPAKVLVATHSGVCVVDAFRQRLAGLLQLCPLFLVQGQLVGDGVKPLFARAFFLFPGSFDECFRTVFRLLRAGGALRSFLRGQAPSPRRGPPQDARRGAAICASASSHCRCSHDQPGPESTVGCFKVCHLPLQLIGTVLQPGQALRSGRVAAGDNKQQQKNARCPLSHDRFSLSYPSAGNSIVHSADGTEHIAVILADWITDLGTRNPLQRW